MQTRIRDLDFHRIFKYRQLRNVEERLLCGAFGIFEFCLLTLDFRRRRALVLVVRIGLLRLLYEVVLGL